MPVTRRDWWLCKPFCEREAEGIWAIQALSPDLCFLSTFKLKCDSPGFLLGKIPAMSSMQGKKSCWQEKVLQGEGASPSVCKGDSWFKKTEAGRPRIGLRSPDDKSHLWLWVRQSIKHCENCTMHADFRARQTYSIVTMSFFEPLRIRNYCHLNKTIHVKHVMTSDTEEMFL